MTEYVVIGDQTIECSEIKTDIGKISFVIPSSNGRSFDELYALFEAATMVQTAGEQTVDEKLVPVVHGTYPDVELEFGGKFAKTGAIRIDMHMLTETEKRLNALEKAQAELTEDQEIQNGAIAELGEMIGG